MLRHDNDRSMWYFRLPHELRTWTIGSKERIQFIKVPWRQVIRPWMIGEIWKFPNRSHATKNAKFQGRSIFSMARWTFRHSLLYLLRSYISSCHFRHSNTSSWWYYGSRRYPMIPLVRPVVVRPRYRAAKVEPRCPTVRKFRLLGADLGFTAAN